MYKFDSSSNGITDTGLVRDNNEDTFVLNPELGFCLVSDGMGGEAAGEVASQIFADTANQLFFEYHHSPKIMKKYIHKFFHLFNKQLDHGESKIRQQFHINRNEEEASEIIEYIFESAHENIQKMIKKKPHYSGMGCTGDILVLFDKGIMFGHLGDGRIYHFRNNKLKQITKDHSYIQDRISKGKLTPEKAHDHPFRNVILKYIGNNEKHSPDIKLGKIKPGDLFLLCSDGLTDKVDDKTIEEILKNKSQLNEKNHNLIELAKSAGGDDNVTVVLVRIIEQESNYRF